MYAVMLWPDIWAIPQDMRLIVIVFRDRSTVRLVLNIVTIRDGLRQGSPTDAVVDNSPRSYLPGRQ